MNNENSYPSQEEYNKVEKEYLEAKLEFIAAKEKYELEKARAYTRFKTIALSEGRKPTIEDIKNELLVQQSNPDTFLGKAFIEWASVRAKKSRLYVDVKCAERVYWNSIR